MPNDVGSRIFLVVSLVVLCLIYQSNAFIQNDIYGYSFNCFSFCFSAYMKMGD